MRSAFKEWAIVVDALGSGGQMIILRKGGISEGRGGFKPEHSRFLLFPTWFHQQREQVVSAAQSRYDLIAPQFPSGEKVRLEFYAELVATEQLHSPEQARSLRGQHIWREEVIAERFEWGREKALYALPVRVFKLPSALELPFLPAYGGCKSWVDLEMDCDVSGSRPVLEDAAFGEKLERMRAALGPGQPAGTAAQTELNPSRA